MPDRGKDGRGLMPRRDELDLRNIGERIEDRTGSPTGNAERRTDAMRSKRTKHLRGSTRAGFRKCSDLRRNGSG